MKIKDITVGEEYSVGYYGRAEILETFVLRGKRRDGVKVLMMEGFAAGREEVFSSREVNCHWSERQAEKDLDDLRRKIEDRQRQKTSEKVEVLEKAFAAAGIPIRGADTCRDWCSDQSKYFANFSIEHDDIELLLGALTTLSK